MNELRAAIRVAGIVEGVDADDDISRLESLRPTERKRQENRVPRGDVGGGDSFIRQVPVVRDIDIRGERRPAYPAQVDAQFLVARDTERPADHPRRVDLPGMPLAVVNGQRVQDEPAGFRDGGRRCESGRR